MHPHRPSRQSPAAQEPTHPPHPPTPSTHPHPPSLSHPPRNPPAHPILPPLLPPSLSQPRCRSRPKPTHLRCRIRAGTTPPPPPSAPPAAPLCPGHSRHGHLCGPAPPPAATSRAPQHRPSSTPMQASGGSRQTELGQVAGSVDVLISYVCNTYHYCQHIGGRHACNFYCHMLTCVYSCARLDSRWMERGYTANPWR